MTLPSYEIGLGFGRRAIYSMSEVPLTADTTGSSLSVMVPMANSPVLTLPADGHQYRVTLNATSLSVAVAAGLAAVGLGTAPDKIIRYCKVGYSGLLNLPCYLHADVTGLGQVISVYAYSSNRTIVTVEADLRCPAELSAMLVAA